MKELARRTDSSIQLDLLDQDVYLIRCRSNSQTPKDLVGTEQLVKRACRDLLPFLRKEVLATIFGHASILCYITGQQIFQEKYFQFHCKTLFLLHQKSILLLKNIVLF